MPGRNPRAVLAGYRSRMVGNAFEEIIKGACLEYKQRGLADIGKTPEPMKPIGAPNPYGQFKACFTSTAQPDFQGTLKGGRSIMFEAKSTETGRMLQSRVTPDQTEYLDSHSGLGAVCFVLITFDMYRAYRVPWDVWGKMKQQFGRKYITEAEAKPFLVPRTHLGTCAFLHGIVEG